MSSSGGRYDRAEHAKVGAEVKEMTSAYPVPGNVRP
jgi:hypothetical protein